MPWPRWWPPRFACSSSRTRLKRDGHTVLFGALCGFGLLLKVSFPLFVLPALVYVWFTSGRRVRPLLWIALPCLLLALPWYAGHLRPTLANALDAGFGAPAAIQGTGPIFSIRTIVTYLSHVAATGVSYYYVATCAVGGPGPGNSTQWKGSAGAADCLAPSLRRFCVRRQQGCAVHRPCAARGGAGAGVVAGFHTAQDSAGHGGGRRDPRVSDAANARGVVRRSVPVHGRRLCPPFQFSRTGITTRS